MKVTILSIKVEKELEILVGSITKGHPKLEESVSAKLLTCSDVLCFTRSMLSYLIKLPMLSYLITLLSFSNNDSIISFVKLFICRDECL